MKSIFFILIILFILVVGFSGLSYAQCPTCITKPHFVMNDEFFTVGDKLIINGTVPSLSEDVENYITIQLIDNNNKIYFNDRLELGSYRLYFEHVFCGEGQAYGKHKIVIDYNGRDASKSFTLVDNHNESRHTSCECNVVYPQWIKNIAKWWADDKIDDKTFVNAFQYLIKENIVSKFSKYSSSNSQDYILIKYPEIINMKDIWSEKQVQNKELCTVIDFLIEKGIFVL